MSELRKVTLILCLAAAAASSPALAQSQAPSRSSEQGQIAVEGFVLERVPRLAFGVPLNFSVFGTERAAVTVYLEGVPGLVELREVQPGVYEGSHVIGAQDALRSDSRVVATMQRRGQIARATFGEPLVLAAVALPWGAAGSASLVEAAAVPMPVPVTATVPLARPAPAPAQVAPARCADCGVVEAIRAVEAPEPESVPGKLARAFDEHRKRVLGVLDAVGLPFAGRERDRVAEGTMAFDVVLRLEDGRAVTRRYATRPTFRVGDTVTLPPADRRLAADS